MRLRHITEKGQKGHQSWPIHKIFLPQDQREHWEFGLDQMPWAYMVTSGFAVSTKRTFILHCFLFHTSGTVN